MNLKNASVTDGINPARLVTLSDGVFAIAITLLVFNLKVPDIPEGSVHRMLPVLVRAMMPHFLAYVISFLLVAVHWTIHHRILDLVTHVNTTFIWINLIYLLMIAFIPFLSALIGSYPEESFSLVFYVSFMSGVLCVSTFMWWYASHNHRLIKKDIPQSLISYFYARAITTAVVFISVLFFSLNHLHWAKYCLFILLPLHWSIRKFYERPNP